MRSLEITGTTGVLGVFGCPVEHSFSPPMQNAAIKELGLDLVYVPFKVAPQDLEAAVRGAAALGLTGFNVTIPHKEAIIPLLDELDEEARLVGAVNTVVYRRGKLVGYTTDGYGFLKALSEEAAFDPTGKECLILGAGGAARSICISLGRSKAATLTIANRTKPRAERLAAEVARLTGVKSMALPLSGPALQDAVGNCHLLVNATSYGMYPKHECPPIIAEDWLSPSTIVCDIVYNPIETSLLRAARRRGCSVVNGCGMLVHQGARSLELWTGCRPPVAVMKRKLLQSLRERS